MRRAPRVVKTPGTCSGDPRLEGHRLPVHNLVALMLAYRGDWSQVHAEFPYLTIEQVKAVVRYWGEHRAEVEALIERNRVAYERLRVLEEEK